MTSSAISLHTQHSFGGFLASSWYLGIGSLKNSLFYKKISDAAIGIVQQYGYGKPLACIALATGLAAKISSIEDISAIANQALGKAKDSLYAPAHTAINKITRPTVRKTVATGCSFLFHMANGILLASTISASFVLMFPHGIFCRGETPNRVENDIKTIYHAAINISELSSSFIHRTVEIWNKETADIIPSSVLSTQPMPDNGVKIALDVMDASSSLWDTYFVKPVEGNLTSKVGSTSLKPLYIAAAMVTFVREWLHCAAITTIALLLHITATIGSWLGAKNYKVLESTGDCLFMLLIATFVPISPIATLSIRLYDLSKYDNPLLANASDQIFTNAPFSPTYKPRSQLASFLLPKGQ